MNQLRHLIFIAFLLTTFSLSAAKSVETISVSAGSIKETLNFSGETKPFLETFVTTDISGRIETLLAENGDKVKASQPIIRLEPERYQIALQQAEANLAIAQAQAAEKEKSYKRNMILFKKRVVNERAFDIIETTYKTAKTQVKQAEVSVRLAKLNLHRTRIKARINGYFVNRQGFVGQGVAPGMLLGKVVELKRLFVEVKIPESQIHHLKVGQSCTIENTRPARIAHIDLYADSSRSFLVKILLQNTDLKYKANMFVKGQIVIQKYENIPVIPVSSILRDGKTDFVYLVRGSKAEKREVSVIAREGDSVYAKGISIGDQLVTVGQQNLKNGDEIELSVRSVK